MSARGRRGAGVLAALAMLLALAPGCGAEQAPVDAVPQLDRMLTSVDEAMAARRYGPARTRIDALVDEVTRAREAGDLDPGQADRILAAAAELLSALPTPAPAKPKPKPSPTAPASPSPAPADPPPASSGGDAGSGGSGGADKNSGTKSDDRSGAGNGGKGSGKGGGKGKGGAKRKG